MQQRPSTKPGVVPPNGHQPQYPPALPPQPYTAQPPQPYPYPQAQQRRVDPPKRSRRKPGFFNKQILLALALGIPIIGVIALIGALGLGWLVIYGGGNVVPGVSAGGVELGGKSEAEAAQALSAGWNNDAGILLRDGNRSWTINPAELGLGINAEETAAAAHNWGRSEGGFLGAIEAVFYGTTIQPRLNVDLNRASTRLEELRSVVEQPAVNAGVRLINGQVQPVPPVQGRVLNLEATMATLQTDAANELADGALDLVMIPVAPAVTDASPLVQQASALLNSSLMIDAYDPITDQSQVWSLSPAEWSQWLVASPDASNPLGISLALDPTGLTTYLNSQANLLPAGTFLKPEETVGRLNQALASNNLNTWTQIYHATSTYTVQAGETMSSIGYDLGIPYPWIQAANPGVSNLNPGETITIPSRDDLIPLPIIRNKRIIISISEQHLWAYENGNLIFDWVISTGIARSPTSPGVFQIRSHEPNAYAAQWNLYMPHFMGVYNPGPGVDVMNGFHGFPTDASGGYLLWTNNLGRPATYGCILLSLENGETLYNWAEEGVIVEIRK